MRHPKASFVPILAVAFAVAFASGASALEKNPGPAPPPAPQFRSGSTVEVAYYNLCTGAVWNWSGVPSLATYGVLYDDVSPEDDLIVRTHFFFAQGAPAGYGYTTMAQILPTFVPTCPNLGTMGREFFLPRAGWTTIEWNEGQGVPVGDFWLLVTHPSTPGNPTVIVTERGQDDPGGRPGGCGTCFAPNRRRHSLFFGDRDKIVCPGIPWTDASPCDLELVWKSDFRVETPVSVESATWGRVKSLYR